MEKKHRWRGETKYWSKIAVKISPNRHKNENQKTLIYPQRKPTNRPYWTGRINQSNSHVMSTYFHCVKILSRRTNILGHSVLRYLLKDCGNNIK